MTIFTALAIYMTIWWTVLFAVLPLGVTSHAEAATGVTQVTSRHHGWPSWLARGVFPRRPEGRPPPWAAFFSGAPILPRRPGLAFFSCAFIAKSAGLRLSRVA